MWPASAASPSPSFPAHKKLLGAVLLWLLVLAAQSASAQNFSVIYNFTGGNDGANPAAGVTLDRGGNLYGTTQYGGARFCLYFGQVGCGTVYKLSHHGSSWVFAPLRDFTGVPDGSNPQSRVVFGPNGALFGTTTLGGSDNYGTVFELKPPPTTCRNAICPWLETQLVNFEGSFGNGAYPGAGDLIFDPEGNIFGTIGGGGGLVCDDEDCGGAFTLSPDGHGGWTYNAAYFGGGISFSPIAGLVRDPSGNLYGTTPGLPGGIYQYLYNSNVVDTLYFFSGSATQAIGGLISDSAGTLYGTTAVGGTGGGGIVFQFVPSSTNLTVLYNLAGSNQDRGGPTATLLRDSGGNLYGITHLDGAHNQGSVFKLSQSGGVWTLTTLHDFTGGADGGQPFGQLTMDASGNIYGTAQVGGSSVGNCYHQLGCGVVFEITP